MRFLTDVGGGKIAGFQGKDIVLVEDEDGFQIPAQITDVVVVEHDDYSTRRIMDAKKKEKGGKADSKPIIEIPDDDEDYDPSDRPITFKAPVEERKGGEQLNAYIAFVPKDVKSITSSRFETYFVNDCNYYLHYTYLVAEGAGWQLHSAGEVEPNTTVFVEEFGREELTDMTRICVQLVAYKREKPFLLKPAADVQHRIDPVKFYKLHTFQPNDFFDQPALLYTIIENDKEPRPLVVDADRLKKEMLGKAAADNASRHQPAAKAARAEDRNAPIVVDLHADELLDTTAGMTTLDVLNYQLDVFRNTLKEHAREKGRKVVFIHGKGEGVLRSAIVNELRYRFKGYTYQDASFREYGYGATQVTIK